MIDDIHFRKSRCLWHLLFFTKQPVLFAILICLTISCKPVIKKHLQVIKEKEFLLDSNLSLSPGIRIDIYSNKVNDYLYYIDFNTSKLKIKALNDTTGYCIDLHKIDTALAPELISACYIHNLDSIFLVYDYSYAVKIINYKGQVLANDLNFKHLMKDYGSASLFMNSIYYKNDYLYIPVGKTETKQTTKKGTRKHYDFAREIKFNIKNTNKHTFIDITPGYLNTSPNYYYNYMFFRTIVGDQYIYTFQITDSAYLYKNDKLMESKPIKSNNFAGLSPFNEDSFMNLSYVKRYSFNQPSYGNLIYQPNNHLFLRTVYFPIVYDKDDYKIENRHPYSFMVLDQEMNQIDEIPVDYKTYSDFVFIPYKEGFLMQQDKGSSYFKLAYLKIK